MRGHDQHNVGGFLPALDNCQNYSHLFQIHRKQDQDGSSQVNRPYLSLYWYTCLPPPQWSMTATKRHKMYFYKTPLFSHSVAAWLMGWKIYYKVPKETQYRFNVKLWPTAWGCDWGLGLGFGEPVSDYTTSMFCCCYTYIAISKIDLDLGIFFFNYTSELNNWDFSVS